MKNKYEHIAEDLKKEILTGIYKNVDILPAGKILAKNYNTSLITITKAINILTLEGLLLRKKGAGTFIKKDLSSTNFGTHLQGTSNKMGKENVTSHILKFNAIPCPEKIASILNIKTGTFVYEIIRVRAINEKRSIIEYTYMPIDLIPGLTIDHLHDSIYDYIKKELNIKIKSSNLIIKSALPTELELENLDFSQEKFLIETAQIVYSDSFQIVEYSIARHVHETFMFETTYVR